MKLSDLPQEFLQDPLYYKVLTAKNKTEYNKNLNILLSIRGNDAVNSLKTAIKEKECKKWKNITT